MKMSNANCNVKKGLVLVLALGVFLLDGCGKGQSQDHVPYWDVPYLEADLVMEGLQNKDPSIIAEKFCPYVRENYPNLEDRITDWMTYLEGDIVSYNEARKASESKASDYGENNKDAVCMCIENVKTSTGRTYEIIFDTNVIYDEHPELKGITFLRIVDRGRFNVQDGSGLSVEGISKDLAFPNT